MLSEAKHDMTTLLLLQYRKRYAVRHVTLSEAKRPDRDMGCRDASLRSA